MHGLNQKKIIKLLKVIKEALVKWKDTTVMTKRTQYQTDISSSQIVHKFSAIPKKILRGFLEHDKLILFYIFY